MSIARFPFQEPLIYAIAGAIGILVLRLLVRKPRRSASVASSGDEVLPYRLRADFLSVAELSFYLVLRSAIDDRIIICPKVNLGDLFFVVDSAPGARLSHRNRIDRKHVDFVLCDVATMHPICGIELDDASHERSQQIKADQFQDEVFKAAGLPLLRVRAARAYTPTELKSLVEPYLSDGQVTKPHNARSTARDETPVCSKCGTEMVRREAKRGANAGRAFWGCANYPKCREVLPLKEAR